jgi:UTP--glucose-1-phosphate uridylyltransferase
MLKVTKAIISTAGYGTRRLPITKAVEKNMLPLGNRPVIDYVVEECARAGITDIYLVVNDKNGQIAQYYGDNRSLRDFLVVRQATEKLAKLQTISDGVKLHFVEQNVNDRYGTAIPVSLAIEAIGKSNEHVVLCNGDDPFWGAKDGSDVKTMIDAVRSLDESIVMGYEVAVSDVSKYGIWEVEGDFARGIVEKPEVGTVNSNLANLNRLVMSPKLQQVIVDYVRKKSFTPSDQEYMITDAYSTYLGQGGKMRCVKNTGEWLDCGTQEGWLHANNVVINGADGACQK